MSLITITLVRSQWKFNPLKLLGPPGGFGSVYEGFGENDQEVAIKKLNINAQNTAHREIDIANELIDKEFNHLLPFLDVGKDKDSDFYYTVMPRAILSLQQKIEQEGPINEEEAIDILLCIAYGLQEVNELVHRDLKPGNILYHEDIWKIADFGIARFVEETTSIQTLKNWLSADYAAPEQWKSQRATHFTDIYSLGCIGYAILTGRPPFPGPDREDFREQHLQKNPQPLNDEFNPRLRALLSTMLRKEPRTRPNLNRIIDVLELIQSEMERVGNENINEDLAKVGAAHAAELAEVESLRMQIEYIKRKRAQLASAGFGILNEVMKELSNKISNDVPTAQISGGGQHVLQVKVGNATLEMEYLFGTTPLPEGSFPRSKWDVILGACIGVDQEEKIKYKWSANLWYTNMGHSNEYRWWEIPYMTITAQAGSQIFQPFHLEEIRGADLAASSIGHIYSHAANPRTIDDEDIDDFCTRWGGILAKAYQGQLRQPSWLPVNKLE
jgi:serine/threonine protein kinase